MKILIVEDDFVSRKYMCKLLKSYGECELAVDGEEAVNMFRAAFTSSPYDIVFLDIMMPKLDGQGALSAIRDIEYKNNKIGLSACKIVMTTALKDADNIKHSFREQADGYLIKPILTENLKKIMTKLFEIGE